MPQELCVTINTPYIELDKLLKRENFCASGGEARFVISEGMVLVNDQVELRKRKKITLVTWFLFKENRCGSLPSKHTFSERTRRHL